MNSWEILLITTWWTIDKDYGGGKWVLDFHIGEPIVENVLSQRSPDTSFKIMSLFKKDSLHFKDEDRKLLAQSTINAREQGIIITHGTDTMIESGKVIEWFRGKKEKVIIMLWASRPYHMSDSDAEFNIGYALARVQSKIENGQYGTFVTMNGQCFDIDNVYKWDDGIFRKLIQ